jgi:hypothetical protein
MIRGNQVAAKPGATQVVGHGAESVKSSEQNLYR